MNSTTLPSAMLDAADLTQIGEGGERVIYASAAFPDVVFKLQKPPQARKIKQFDLKSLLLTHWPGFHTYSVRQEYKAYVKAMMHLPPGHSDLPVARLFGFANSTLGPLQICEKITLDGLAPGPSLAQVFRNGGLQAEDVSALSHFAQSLLALDLPTHDINRSNIVKGRGASGQPRFVLVDGVGDIQAIPVRSLSRRVRRARLIKSLSRFQSMGISFDTGRFAFSAKPDAKT